MTKLISYLVLEAVFLLDCWAEGWRQLVVDELGKCWVATNPVGLVRLPEFVSDHSKFEKGLSDEVQAYELEGFSKFVLDFLRFRILRLHKFLVNL